MTTHEDNRDQLLDRNLFEIGKKVTLPKEPTVFQQSRWKRPPAAGATARIVKGVKRMKRHRLFAFLGAGSVVAASVALSVTFLSPGANNRVEAATIFQSFRDSVKQAFAITFDNVVEDGYRVDGELLVVLHEGDGPTASKQSMITGDIEEEGAYLEMHIRSAGDDAAAKAPGLDLELALAATEGNEWIFIQPHEIPKQLQRDEPFLAMLASLAEDGLLLELDGLLRQGSLFTKMEVRETGKATEEQATQPRNSFMFHVGVEMDDRPPPGKVPEDGPMIKLDLSAGNGGGGADSESRITRRQAQQQLALESAAASLGMEYDEMVQVTEAISNMFTGRMTREQLESVISWIESSASDVSIEEQGDGLFVLTAKGFDLSEWPLDSEVTEELAKNSIEIGYRKETGVEWAAVLNIGEEQGRMTFEFVDRDTGDAVFNRKNRMDQGVRVLDLSSLSKMFSGSK